MFCVFYCGNIIANKTKRENFVLSTQMEMGFRGAPSIQMC